VTWVFGPSAAEASWEDARAKVRSDLWRPSSSALPDDQVDRALHSALLELESERRWLWLEGLQAALTMPAQADNVALPATIKSVTSIAYLSGNTGYDVLTQSQLHQVRQAARGTSPGAPTYYARTGGQLYFDSTLALGDELELVYTSGCSPYLELAIASPPITLTLQMPAIVARAAAFVALTYLHDTEKGSRQLTAYNAILGRLMLEEDTARADGATGGSIMPDTGLYEAAHGS
jgi:hypothetical protein